MVEAVQKRDHGRLVHALGRRQLERRLELRRLCRHPEHIDLLLEPRGANVDVEVAEHRTLDDQAAAVPLQRVGPHEQDDLGSCASKRSGEETADSACADERVAHPDAHSLSPTPTEPASPQVPACVWRLALRGIHLLSWFRRALTPGAASSRSAGSVPATRRRSSGRSRAADRSRGGLWRSGGISGRCQKRRRPLRRRSARYGCGWNRKNVDESGVAPTAGSWREN